jgi:hypothetical protein
MVAHGYTHYAFGESNDFLQTYDKRQNYEIPQKEGKVESKENKSAF